MGGSKKIEIEKSLRKLKLFYTFHPIV